MPILRMQVAMAGDSGLARDRFVITPHFIDRGVTTDTEGLAEDLAAAIAAEVNGTREVEVRCYDVEQPPPNFPTTTAVVNIGQAPPSAAPRELAICLSFYSERSVGRRRGRLYIPLPVISGGTDAGVRPTAAQRQSLASWAGIFSSLGGADVDWCVWSRRDRVARGVTHWFVDDEWDVIRSRGLRPVERTTGTAPDG